ncbi:MAG: hypothetical protein IJM17_02435 [Firmicutes bacterium]|nr:hypothetical protein [Bacillota bacterium]
MKYYYNGLASYYELTENGYRDLTSGKIIPYYTRGINNADDFYGMNGVPVPERGVLSSEGPVYLSHSTRYYNCNTESNLSYFYPSASQQELEANPGVCGSLACAILVAYMDDYKSSLAPGGDFATNWRKNSGDIDLDTYGIDLVAELVDYIEPDGDGSVMLNPGFSGYMEDHNIDGRLSVSILNNYTRVKNTILSDGSGEPIIIGSYYDDHYFVGIGYQNISTAQIKVNWGDGTSRWINASISMSTWKLYLD